MRIRTILLLLVTAAGIVGWQAETRASLKQRLLLRSLAAQLAPWGVLSYGPTTAHFWGRGEIRDLRFTPSPEWQAEGALHIPLLRYRDWQGGEAWPAAVHLQFDTATMALPEPWPTQARGELDWRYRATEGDLRLQWSLDAPASAAIEATLALQLTQPRQLRGATLASASLRYRDQGLAQGERAALGQRLGADPQNAEAALAEQISQWLTVRGLPPNAALASALREFTREPLAATLSLDPPGAIRPETLPQFAPADRITALGLRLEPR